ncbi:MAG: radical SAM protein [Candidatus Nanoarchaeia archaeon]
MKILLVNPAFIGYKGRDLFPLGLAYLTSVLENHEIKILDLQVQKLNDNDLEKEIEWPDIVGITCTTPSFSEASKIAQLAKAKQKIVVMGGVHATFCPEDALNYCDIVVFGEGELTFKELCNSLENLEKKQFYQKLQKIKGIAYKKRNKIIINKPRELIDINSLSMPQYNLFPMYDYDIMSVITSRGCSLNCVYCAARNFWQGKVRYRSIKNVVQELKFLKEKYGKTNFKFHDSTFSLNMKRAKELCNAIKPLQLRWSCETKAEFLDKELIKKMADAGCKLIALGIDSGDPKVLKQCNRKANFKKIYEAIKFCKKYNIKTRAYVIVGLPGETEKSMNKTIALINKIKPDFVMLSLATSYPGCNLISSKHEFSESWTAKFLGHGRCAPIHIPSTLTKKQFIKIADKMWQWCKDYNKKQQEAKNKHIKIIN